MWEICAWFFSPFSSSSTHASLNVGSYSRRFLLMPVTLELPIYGNLLVAHCSGYRGSGLRDQILGDAKARPRQCVLQLG